jgi:kumamolisin
MRLIANDTGGVMSVPIVLAGSERSIVSGAALIGDADPDQPIGILVRLRRRAGRRLDLAPLLRPVRDPAAIFGRNEFASLFGAAAEDIDTVGKFATARGLEVTGSDPVRRSLFLRGTPPAIRAAFGVDVRRYGNDQIAYRGYERAVVLPGELARLVTGVFGLDERHVARAHVLRRAAWPGHLAPSLFTPGLFTPFRLAADCRFPLPLGAAGGCIGVLAFGAGPDQAELHAGFDQLGIAAPEITEVSLGAVEPDAAAADGLAMTLLTLGALAPGARIVVYRAPPTERGWVEAVGAAVHDADRRPSVLCIGAGWPEELFSRQAVQALDELFQDAAALGVTICVASGDSGSGDGIDDGQAHVDFPAASPFVLACGGSSAGFFPGVRLAWNDGPVPGGGASGGGVSSCFPPPDWQSASNVPLSPACYGAGRGVPDVAAPADPAGGILLRRDDGAFMLGGTGLAAALWAALVANLNHRFGAPLGYLNPLLYALPGGVFDDIVLGGGNDIAGKVDFFLARPGWDACTGLGVPNGVALLGAIGYRTDPAPGPEPGRDIRIDWHPADPTLWPAPLPAARAAWVLGAEAGEGGFAVLHWDGTAWAPIGMFAVRLHFAPDGAPCIVTAAGTALRRQGDSWVRVAGNAHDVTIDPQDRLWIVSRRGRRIYRFDETGDGAWLAANGVADRLAVLRDGTVLAVTPDGRAFVGSEAAA